MLLEYSAPFRESKKAFPFDLNISGAEYPLDTHSSSSHHLYFFFSPFCRATPPQFSIPFGMPASLKDHQTSALAQFPARTRSSFFRVSAMLPRSQQTAIAAPDRETQASSPRSSTQNFWEDKYPTVSPPAAAGRPTPRVSLPQCRAPAGAELLERGCRAQPERATGRGTSKPGQFGGPLFSEMP